MHWKKFLYINNLIIIYQVFKKNETSRDSYVDFNEVIYSQAEI